MFDVPHWLGLLQEDPDHPEALRELREAVASGDPGRLGSDPIHWIHAARRSHQDRGEVWTAAELLEIEARLASVDPDREAALQKELARLASEELLDDDRARAALQRAAQLRPGDREVQEALEALDTAKSNWKDIVKRFLDEAEGASDPTLKTSLLVSAACLVWKYNRKKSRERDTDRLFQRALESDPGDPRANRVYEQVLRQREAWTELGELLLQAAEKTKSRDDRLAFYLRAARVFARRLGNAERAVACYERVLDYAPGHPEAMRFLVDYFTQREKWDLLVQLYESVLRSRQNVETERGILLQLGMVHWKCRRCPADAEPYFARLRKMDPAHPGMLAFYREYLPQIGDHAKLLTILGDAQRLTTDAQLKVELAVEIARAAQASGAADRAIDAWKAVLRQDPRNTEALAALRALYRQTEKWNALVEVLRSEIDALPPSAVDSRVALLREMVSVYREHLHLDAMVIHCWNAILQLVPHDPEALSELARIYEQTGRWNDLIQVLTKQAETETDPQKQVAIYMRVARLWIERFANYNQATRPLELVVERDPHHREALALLKDIYTKKRAWKQLFDIQRAEAELASDPEARQQMRIELARLAGDRLHRHADAIALWKEILVHDPGHAEALDALEKLAEREKDWATLAEVLERRVEAERDDKERVKLLTRLGVLYGEQIKDPQAAVKTWRRVLAIDPKNGRALRTLREWFIAARDWDGLEALYAEQDAWEGLAEVLGNCADRETNPEQKIALSFRAAAVYEDRLGEPLRAFRSYERVLSVDPKNERAARRLIALYEKEEKWARLPSLYEVVLEAIAARGGEGDDERVQIYERLREITAEHLNDPELAFSYQLEAWKLAPRDERVRSHLWSAAERAHAWDRLAAALEARIALAEVDEQLVLHRDVARIAAEKLQDVERAIVHLRAILAAEPRDAEAIGALERIYRTGRRWSDLRELLLHRIGGATDETERWALLRDLATLEESELGEWESAAAHWRQALAIDSADRDALSALQRLAERAGRWEEVVEVIRRRRELETEPGERLELTLRLGEVLVDRAPDHGAAIRELGAVLEAVPAERRAIAALEAIAERSPPLWGEISPRLERAYEAAGEWAKLRALVERNLQRTTDPEEKKALRLRFAELSSTRLDDAKSAYEALENAFLDDPADASLWDRLFAAADRAGRHDALAQAIAMAIEASHLSSHDVARLSEKVAFLYDDVLARPAEAEPFHRRVLSADPLNERSFLALKELYTNTERWDDLQVLYRNRIAQTVDPRARLDLLLQVCFLFEELLGNPVLAIDAYREVLAIDPHHQAARRALERLYAREKRWRDLAALLEEELGEASGEAAIDLLFRLGELHETKLDEPALAVDRYEGVLQMDVRHASARQALERLLLMPGQRYRVAAILESVYEQLRAWADLVRVLEVQIESVHDPRSRVSLLSRVAEIHENRLADPSGAFRAWSRAVECDPSDREARRELARMAAMLGADRDRAAVLERAVESSADAPSLQAELLLEVATVWEDRLGDFERAERAYLRLVDVAIGDPELVLLASRALERIHSARGDHRRLAEDLRLQAKLENDPGVRKSLLVRLGELLETVLDDAEGAIAVQGERLEIDPTDADALVALERLYERLGRWQPLIGVLQTRERITNDDEERKAILRRIGALYEERLDDRDNAIAAYNDVVARFGPDPQALMGLIRLYERAERWHDLLDAIEMLHGVVADPSERAELRFRAAELMRQRTHDLDRAVETYAEVLDAVPSHSGAIDALRGILADVASAGRLAAARVLRPHFEAQGAYSELLEVLEVLAESEDLAERLGALRRAAEVADVAMEDPRRAFDLAARAVRVGLGEPEVADLIADVERLAASSDRWADYVALLREVAPDIADGALQIDTYWRIAETARHRLRDPELARQFYQRILDHEPDHRPALDALEQLTSEAGDHAGLLDVLRRKAELVSGPDRVVLLLRQADLCEKYLGDTRAAVDALEQVLAEDPTQVPAYQALERLYTAAERWNELAALYERMLEHRIGFPVEVRYRLGRLYVEHLGDTAQAVEHFRFALSMGAPHEPTIEQLEWLMVHDEDQRAAAAAILEPIYLMRLAWPKVVAALEARLSGETDIEARKALLTRLGQVHEDYLEDLDGAMAVYARLFREDPRDESTWETLARLAKVLEKWDRLADIYRALIEETGVEDDATKRLAVMAAQIYDQKVGNAERAAELYRKALRFAPEDRDIFTSLEALYRRVRDWDALLALYREQAEFAASDSERIELLEKIALVLRDEKADADGAIDALREVLAIDARNRSAMEALDALLTLRERWVDLADLLRTRIDLETDPRAAADLRHRLGMLLAELGDKRAAIDLFEEITRDDPHHAGAVAALERLVTDPEHQLRIIEILEPIYRATDQWKKRIAVYEALVGLSDDPAEKVRLLVEIAQLHEHRGGDRVLAFHAVARAFVVDPTNEELRAEVDRLGAALGAWDDLVQAYEEAVSACTDASVTSSLLGAIARLHDEKRGDPRAAIETYERLLRHDPDDPSPLDSLEALHTMVGDWRGLVDVLERKVQRSYDPVERGDLLRRAGSILEELLGDREGAIAVYRRAIDEDPNDAIALEALDRLLTEAGDDAALANVLARRIELEQDPELRVEIGLRLGAVAEQRLNDPETAIEAFERVLADRPGERTAILSLARLYERRAMWPQLLENLRLQAAMATGAEDRVALLCRAAEVLERELDEVREAIETYRQVLEIDPRHEAALAALLRLACLEEHRAAAIEILLPLLREQERWDDVAQVLELAVESASDPVEKRDGLRSLAEVHEHRRGDRSAALEAYRRALAEDPSDVRTADDLERLASATGAWERVADVFAARASAVIEPDVARHLYARLARIAEVHLADDVRAIEAYRRALEHANDDEESLLALDRLYQKVGAWRELADILERRIQLCNDEASRVDLLVRLGTLRVDRFGDRRTAFAAFQEVLELRPDHPRALAAMEALLADQELASQAIDVLDGVYRRIGATAKLAALYDVRVRQSSDDGERVALLSELAQLYENELGDPVSALATYVRAFEVDRRDENLLGHIERLAAMVDGWEQVRGLIERVTGSEDLDRLTRRDLELRGASWYRDHLGDLAAAEACLRRALEADPEASEAHAQLVELLRGSGRVADLVAALRAWAAVEYDETLKKERLREAARAAESALGDLQLAASLHRAILEIDPSDVQALDDSIRIRRAEGAWAEVVALLEQRIDVESDLERRVMFRKELAGLLGGPMSDRRRAIDAWRAVLEEVPTDLEAIARLEELYEAAEQWEHVEELIQRRLDIAETPADRIAARVRLARLHEQRFGRRAEAIEQLQDILQEDPHNAETLDELERLYAADGRHAELVALLERRAADAAARGDTREEIEILARLSAAHEKHGETDAAIAVHERILTRDPERKESLRAMARLHASSGRIAEASDFIERLLPLLPPEEARTEAFRLAEIAETQLGDAARSERVLRFAYQLNPRDREARDRLKAHYEKHGAWASLAELLSFDEQETSDKKERIALIRRMADLYAQKLGNPAAAAAVLERAVQIDPDNREILLSLCDLYIAGGRQADAVPVLEKIIASYGNRRTKEVAVYQHRLGQALEALGNTAGALAAYEAAFKIDLTSVPILRDLGRLCYRSGDYDRAQKTFRALLLQKLDPTSGITKGDVYYYLGDISAKQGDTKKAISMLERALAEEAGHVQARQLLQALKG